MPVIDLTPSGLRSHCTAIGTDDLPAGEYRDARLKGFLLHVGKPSSKNPKGAQTWYFDYWSRSDVHRRLPLGRRTALSPDGARKLALKAASDVSSGIDVYEAKKAEKVAADKAKASTLGAFMEHRYESWVTAHLRSGAFAVSRIKADFGDWYPKPMSQITVSLVEKWRQEQLQGGKKPRTINRDLQRLQSALTKAKELELIDASPIAGIKPLRFDKKGRVRYLSATEAAALRAALVMRDDRLRKARDRFNEWRQKRGRKPLPPRTQEFVDHLRPMTLLALNTGLRRGEIFQLRWGHIDAQQRLITVVGDGAKSGQTRHIPLNDEALSTLATWRKQAKKADPESLVFPGRAGQLTRIDNAWESLMTLAKVKNFRFHDCRHDFASRLVMAGVALNTVRELLGHATIEMTMRYAHLAPQHLRAAVANLTAVAAE